MSEQARSESEQGHPGMEGSAPWGVGDGSVSPFPSPLEEETRGRRVRGAEGALPGQVNGWWGTHLSPVTHPLAPRITQDLPGGALPGKQLLKRVWDFKVWILQG